MEKEELSIEENLENFKLNLLNDTEDISPEFSTVLVDYFWDII